MGEGRKAQKVSYTPPPSSLCPLPFAFDPTPAAPSRGVFLFLDSNTSFSPPPPAAYASPPPLASCTIPISSQTSLLPCPFALPRAGSTLWSDTRLTLSGVKVSTKGYTISATPLPVSARTKQRIPHYPLWVYRSVIVPQYRRPRPQPRLGLPHKQSIILSISVITQPRSRPFRSDTEPNKGIRACLAPRHPSARRHTRQARRSRYTSLP